MSKRLTYEQIRNDFFQLTGHRRRYDNGRPVGHNEYPATIRTEFNEYVDHLHRAGEITTSQAMRVTLK